jgi:RNA polymerase sigma-70 factor (ECF subfamily)
MNNIEDLRPLSGIKGGGFPGKMHPVAAQQRREVRASEPAPHHGEDSAGFTPAATHAAGPAKEAATILNAQRGDPVAWEALVREHAGWILHFCCRWTGIRSRAEDLTQEVFIRVYQNLDSYRGEQGGFRVWLGRIARNLLIDDYRKNRRERRNVSYDSANERTQIVIHAVHSGGHSPEADIEKAERKAVLRRALGSLGPELGKAVVLRDVRGLSYQEIAQLLGTPLGTVKSRVSRGRTELARLARQRAAALTRLDSRSSAVA